MERGHPRGVGPARDEGSPEVTTENKVRSCRDIDRVPLRTSLALTTARAANAIVNDAPKGRSGAGRTAPAHTLQSPHYLAGLFSR